MGVVDKKDNRGGVRVGAGSKPLPIGEKKVLLRIYVKEKYLKALGEAKSKDIAEGAVVQFGENAMFADAPVQK